MLKVHNLTQFRTSEYITNGHYIHYNMMQLWDACLQRSSLMDGFKYIFDNQTTHTGTANNEGALVVAFSEYCENCREISLAPSPCCDAAVSRLCSPPLFVFTPGYSRNNSASRCQLCCSAVCTLENYSKHCRMTCSVQVQVQCLHYILDILNIHWRS